MIVDLFDIIIIVVNKKFDELCEKIGVVVMGWVFMFIIVLDSEVMLEEFIEVVNDVSYEYFSCIIVMMWGDLYVDRLWLDV